MLPSLKSKFRYVTVGDNESDPELKLGGHEEVSSYVNVRLGICSALTLVLLLITSIASTWVLFFSSVFRPQNISISTSAPAVTSVAPQWICQQPSVRREWRTLSEPERVDYVSAVNCLATKPSKLRNNGTLYDDFPWVHKHTSSNTHVSAPFLPWHRYYIHLYEKALKEECSYEGQLPYWDWSQDWSSFASSPVWHPTTGLGGNGGGASSVGDGRCVTEGPFAGLEAMFYDGAYAPHCLSRGFADDDELRRLGELVHPQAMADLMREGDYAAFEAGLEKRAHEFLSHSVRGDLSRFTGPNDPVFFLHHTNLDRLWAQWQAVDPARRMRAYNGRASNITDAAATLSDAMDMAGLAKTLPVASVMETSQGMLCYSY